MGYLRFRRSRSLIPGVRMNLSKSGVSWTFGPRGLHYTVGARGHRATAGIPGTGLSYTAYSRPHARHAVATRARRAASGSQPAATFPVTQHAREPMLPRTKLAWAVALILVAVLLRVPVASIPLLLGGVTLAIIGWRQRTEPAWVVRGLVREARRHPDRAEALLAEALGIDAENSEALGAMADLVFAQQRWNDAGAYFARYLAHAPDDYLAVGHAGAAWLNANQPDLAIPLLVRGRDDPRISEESRASLTAALGLAYLKKSLPDQALTVVGSQPLSRHVLDEGLQQCLFIRAMAEYNLGRRSKGIADLDRLARLNPAFEHLEEARQEMLTGTFTLSPTPA